MRPPRSASRPLFVLPLTFVVGVVTSACSGKLATETTAGGDASPQSDGGLGARPSACPATLPEQGTPCTKDRLLCEYGDDYNPLCNTVRVCSTDRWASPIYYGGRPTCPSTMPTVPPNPAGCAPTASAVPAGMACSTSTACNYDGATCSCGVHCAEYPIRQPDCDADAGRTTSCCDTSKVTWACFSGPHYCPVNRPRVGTACTTEGDSCAFDAPVECGQTVIACQNGLWDLTNATCPISSERFKRDISYVDEIESTRLHDDLMNVRLATYRYKAGDDAAHLGFIIEDMPRGSPAVLPSRDRVDLYGYVSMTVASLQRQQKELDTLRSDMALLAKENAAMKRRKCAP